MGRVQLILASRKAVLQQELEDLRSRIPPEHSSAGFADIAPQRAGTRSESTPSLVSPYAFDHGSVPSTAQMTQDSLPSHYLDNSSTRMECTTACSLEGVWVEGFKIDDCFSLFFKHYHSILPILDPTSDPATYLKLSPIVFWSIVVTGSRRYDLDPTLLARLAPGVTRLAGSSLVQMSSYLTTISGLLMLSTWPLPMVSTEDDPSSTFCGAALQLALQNGLQLTSKKPESARKSPKDVAPLNEQKRAQDVSRLRLWAYLELVYHSTNVTRGLPLHFVSDAFDHLEHGDRLVMKSIPQSTYWMQRFEKAFSRSIASLFDITSQVNGELSSALINPLIDTFEDQILEISRNATIKRTDSVLPNPLIVGLAQIQIKAFCLLAHDASSDASRMIGLYHTVCSWTEQASNMDRTEDWALYCSEPYFRTILLVAMIILRISRHQELKYKVDLRWGEKSYFAAVKLLKRRSLQPNDVNSQTSTALSSLWHSEDWIKRQGDTSSTLVVRIRGRGAMGIVYDCLWPWQNESRQVVQSNAALSATTPASNDLQTMDTDFPAFANFPCTPVDDNWFPNLLDATFESHPSEAQWQADDLFWV